MNRNKLIFSAILAILFLIGGTLILLEWFGPPRTMTLIIWGLPGRQVVGHVVVDGVEQPVKGALPLKLSYSGRDMSFAIAPQKNLRNGKTWLDADLAKIDVQVALDGEDIGSGIGNGVKGSVYRSRVLGRYWERFEVDEMTEAEIEAARKQSAAPP